MSTLLTVLHVITCLFLMLTVLLQSGKGGGMGGAFGGSNAGTVFGGSGGSSFLRKLTAGASTVFMLTSIVLAYLASHNSADSLEKFGENQAKLAAEKEAAKAKAFEKGGAGSGSAGSGSAGSGSAGSGATVIKLDPTAGSGTIVIPPPATPGSNAGSAGSAAVTPEAPAMGEPKPATGSNAAPVTKPGPNAGASTTPEKQPEKPVTGTAAPVTPQPDSAKKPEASTAPSAPSTP